MNWEEIHSLEHILFVDDIEHTTADRNQKDLIEWDDLEDGFPIHYRSGSTGKPRGVLHAHRAIIHHYESGEVVLDVRDDDVYRCTSHPGWITSSVYGLFAP